MHTRCCAAGSLTEVLSAAYGQRPAMLQVLDMKGPLAVCFLVLSVFAVYAGAEMTQGTDQTATVVGQPHIVQALPANHAYAACIVFLLRSAPVC